MEEYPKVDQPPPDEYRRNLFPHQLTSVHQMEEREREPTINLDNVFTVKTRVSIQADMTGYGKTASCVVLTARDKMPWDLNSPYISKDIQSASPGIVVERYIKRDKMPVTLVVCSQSLIAQWKHEFALAPKLNIGIIKTRKKARELDPWNCNEKDCPRPGQHYDVVICTPTMYNLHVDRFKNRYAWKRFIYDEPPSCNIRAMSTIYAGMIWLVSATPDLIKYKYSTARRDHMIASMCLTYIDAIFWNNALIVKNSEEYVKASWEMPPVTYIDHLCYQPISSCIRGFVSDRVQNMIDAGNIRGAINQLGGRSCDGDVTELVRRNLELDLEDARGSLNRSQRRNNQSAIDNWTEKIEQIERQLVELAERYANFQNQTCPICFEPVGNHEPIIVPCCNNVFGGACLMNWLNQRHTCPSCRDPIEDESRLIHLASNTDEVHTCGEREPTKCETIVNILKENKEGKFIIFSSEDATFELIRRAFVEENIKCKEIKGRAESRNKTIAEFKEGKLQVIFLNSNNNGSGLNLQECTDIILYHTMIEGVKTQIIGRANRIGRQIPLRIHQLTTQ